MSDSKGIALTSSRETLARTSSGYLMLLLLVVAIAWQVWGIVNLARGAEGAMAHIVAGGGGAPGGGLFRSGGETKKTKKTPPHTKIC
jgi:hypothetical protein